MRRFVRLALPGNRGRNKCTGRCKGTHVATEEAAFLAGAESRIIQSYAWRAKCFGAFRVALRRRGT